MNNSSMLALSVVVVLILLLWLTHRWQNGVHEPLTLSLARLLRRLGRWLWALGEAVEVGYFHARQVRKSIHLELEPAREVEQ